MLLPLGLAYTLTSRLKPVVKVFLGYASLVILAGIAVTVSRGTYVSTALALLLFFGVLLFHRTYRLPSLVLLVVILAARGLLPAQELSGSGTPQADVRRERGRRRRRTRGSCSGRQPCGSGRRMSGGAWGRRITITGSASFGRRRCSCGPAGRTTIICNALAEWGVVGTALVASAWVLLGLGVLKTWPCVRGTPRDLGAEQEQQQIRLRARRVARFGGHSGPLGGGFQHAHPGQCDSGDCADGAVEQSSALRHRAVLGDAEAWGKAACQRQCVLAGVVYLGQQGWHHAARICLAEARRPRAGSSPRRRPPA